jgi:gamma-glutamyltranspeptidase/glutathione hydrolase
MPNSQETKVLRGTKGVVAAGHEVTAEAAAVMLREGGNAFDAALGALCASCVAEPVLASLGGGGFLLAGPAGAVPLLYDFFAQTPKAQAPGNGLDFYPILADFGDAQQEFHIGLGSMATPGCVRGLFLIHRDLCRLPLDLIIEPACQAARQGVRLNALQHYISTIVEPILRASPEALALHASTLDPNSLAVEGETLFQPAMADSFEGLLAEGEDLFYRGAMGQELVAACREGGGHLSIADLLGYRVEKRVPLTAEYRGARLFANPAPSLGGTLICFTLKLLEQVAMGEARFGGERHLRLLARAMRLTQDLRRRHMTPDQGLAGEDSARLLGDPLIAQYRRLLTRHRVFSRGTTQISIADAEGNLASMTLSNGEGSGYVIPGTGIMINNMLGEEDLNPWGFHRWPEDRRIASMMAPTLMFTGDGLALAIGSGGSNRIRSAILQVLCNLVDFRMSLEQAVTAPRMHFESGLLNLEPEREPSLLHALADEFPRQKCWNDRNLFFGGTHSVIRDPIRGLSGIGDPRRGGVCMEVRNDNNRWL